MNAIICCVDMADLLQLTLPYNRHHFDGVTVVTSPYDTETIEVAKRNNAAVYSTLSFYANGARFNKFLAMEEGLDYMGREGWICILDCDILWPKEVPGGTGKDWAQLFTWRGALYTPLRRMVPIPIDGRIDVDNCWRNYMAFPRHPQQVEWAGYTQIFHAQDSVLGPPPWHEANWIHAGGADSFFQNKWAREHKLRPPWEVLHLGESGVNWLGRVTRRLDGSIPEGAEERKKELQDLLRMRRLNPHDRYGYEKI